MFWVELKTNNVAGLGLEGEGGGREKGVEGGRVGKIQRYEKGRERERERGVENTCEELVHINSCSDTNACTFNHDHAY